MFFPISGARNETSLQEYTLILPAVSVGNVGQLTVDLLVSTLPTTKIGYFHSDCVQPIFGYSDSTSQNIVTACEAYEILLGDRKFIIIQQRGLCVKGKKRKFATALINWIQNCNFKSVIILTSSFAHMRTDEQLAGSLFRYICTSAVQNKETLSILPGWVEWENSQDANVKIAGGGLTSFILQKCNDLNIPTIALVQFCDEGDNRPDAYTLAKSLNIYLKFVAEKPAAAEMWVCPPSWNLPFGNEQPDLY